MRPTAPITGHFQTALILLLALILPGCVVVVDTTNDENWNNSSPITRSTQIDNVRQVVFKIHGRLHIDQGEVESLRIEGPSNIVDGLRVRQTGDKLRITSDNRVRFGFQQSRDVDVYLTITDLDSLDMDGHGNVDLQSLDTDRFHASLNGHGKLFLDKLSADQVTLKMNGHGNIQVGDLIARKVDTELRGHGNIRINNLESNDLNVDITGHGNIDITGQSESQQVAVNGHGSYRGNKMESQQAHVTVGGHGRADIWAIDNIRIKEGKRSKVRFHGNPEVSYAGGRG